jgi:hypothetical protein
MKKHLIFSAFLVLLAIGKTMAQTYVPIATTGYSLDGVAENTTAVSTTGGALDASDFILYSQFYGTLYSTSAVGIPNNGLIASGTRTYQLQAYTGFNVMHLLASNKDSLNFVNPQPYPTISLLGFGTQGAATVSITVRFTDNSTQVFSPITMDDWFTANPSVYNGFDRAQRTSGTPAYVASAGNPRMFGYDLPILCSNQGKSIKRVIILNNSASAQVCVLAVSGTLPAYSINANPPFLCSSGSTTLTGVGLSSYTWQPLGTFAGSNSATVSVSPSATSIYTLLGTDSSGCPGYTTITVNVNGAPPTLSLTGSSSSVCLGAAATLSASGAVTYTWTGGVTNGIPFTPSVTTTYTVTGQNGCGTTTSVSTLTVAPIPVSLASTGTVVCTNRTATLTASASAFAYTWLPINISGTMSSIVISPSVNTVYTVAVSNGTCLGTGTISILANPVPTITSSSNSGSICPGSTTTLSANGGINYTWTPVNQNNSSISVSPTVTTTYSLVGDNSFGCLNVSFLTVTVGIKPNLGLSASSNTICNGGSTTLTANAANSYTWTNGPSTNTYVVSPTQQTSYTVTGTNATSGCNDTKTIDVYVFTPTVAVAGNTAVCTGSPASFTASGAGTYNWLPGGLPFATVTFTPTSNSVYTVNATSTFAFLTCQTSATIGVSVNPAPTLTTTIKKTILCVKEPNILSAGGASTYVWSSMTGTLSGATITVTPNTSGLILFTVTGTNSFGCAASTTVQMTVNKCTGIETYTDHAAKISIYPNPASAAFTIQSEAATDLVICNELGQFVRSIKLDESNAYKANIEGLASGIYVVSSFDKTIAFRQKIVVTK